MHAVDHILMVDAKISGGIAMDRMKKIEARMFAQISTLVVAAASTNWRSAVIQRLSGSERGDADSAGSTLRTIMVVIIVTAVVTAIGAAVRSAGSRAAGCIQNAGC